MGWRIRSRLVGGAILLGIAAIGLMAPHAPWPDQLWGVDPCAQFSQPFEGRINCYRPGDRASIAARYGKPLLDPSAVVAREAGMRLSALYTFQLPRSTFSPSRPTDPILDVTYQYGAWQGAGCGPQTIARSFLGYRWFPTITVPPYVAVDESGAVAPFARSTGPISGTEGAGCSVWATRVYAPGGRIAIAVSSNISQAVTERVAGTLHQPAARPMLRVP